MLIPAGWKQTSATSISTDDGGHYVLRFDLREGEKYEAWRRPRLCLGLFQTPELAVAACEQDRAEIKRAMEPAA